MKKSVKEEIGQLVDSIEIATPFDVDGGCTCGNSFDCECLAMTLTVACNEEGTEWSYQTGDNSYTGACYFHTHWAVTEIGHDDDRAAITKDIINQLEELRA